jgi:hypothetical protein
VPCALVDRISHRVDPILNSIYHPAPTLDAPSSPLHAGSQEAEFGACEETPGTPRPPPYKSYCLLQYDTDSRPATYVCLRHERTWCPSYKPDGLQLELLPAADPPTLSERIEPLPLTARISPSNRFIADLFPSSHNSRHSLPNQPVGSPNGVPQPNTHRGPQRARLQPAPYTPINRLVDFNFRKKRSDETTAIFRVRLRATSKRVSAIFNRPSFGQLPHDVSSLIQRLANQLDWLSEHVEEIANLKEAQQHAIEWGLKHIGAISFKDLRINFRKIAQQLADIRGLGFFDHVDPKAPTFAPQFCT